MSCEGPWSVRAVIRVGTSRLEATGLAHARPPTNLAIRFRRAGRTEAAQADGAATPPHHLPKFPRKITVGGEGTTRPIRQVGWGARHEAEWLLGRLLDARPLELYLQDEGLPEQTVERFMSQINARSSGMPLQYLLGETEFCGARFTVVPGVFIPRPETETIVEAAMEVLRRRGAPRGRGLRLLDLGTGSGCIAVTLARYLPACVVVGVELSWEALCVAKANVLRHGLSERVHLVHGRWLDAIRGPVDGIISNPPYICSAQVDHLPLDVRHEPRLGLDGGGDGMRDLLQLVEQAPHRLAPGGVLVLECGEEQVGVLTRMVQRAAWAVSVEPLDDLAGRPRGVLAIRAK